MVVAVMFTITLTLTAQTSRIEIVNGKEKKSERSLINDKTTISVNPENNQVRPEIIRQDGKLMKNKGTFINQDGKSITKLMTVGLQAQNNEQTQNYDAQNKEHLRNSRKIETDFTLRSDYISTS